MADYLIKSSGWLPSWFSDFYKTEETLFSQDSALTPDEFKETLQNFASELKVDASWKRYGATGQLSYFGNLAQQEANQLEGVSGQLRALAPFGKDPNLSPALKLYNEIRFNPNLPQSAKMVKAFKWALAAAIATGDEEEIRTQIENGLNLLRLADIIEYKKDLSAYSASPVHVGHVPFKFHYEKESDDSFIPRDTLNNTTIAREYEKVRREDSLRAEALAKLLETMNQTEDYLNSGNVGSELPGDTISAILAHLEKGISNTHLDEFLMNLAISKLMEEIPQNNLADITRPMEKNIDDQLHALQAMLALAEDVSGRGRDHISPIKYTIELLESAKWNLKNGDMQKAEAFFLEAIMSPHFEYVQRIAELNENALWTRIIFETGVEVGLTILAASFAQVTEAGVAATFAWGNIRRIRTAEEVIALFKSTALRSRALRFAANSAGFSEASRILHGQPFWDDKLSGPENVAAHISDAAQMAFTLGSIKLGMSGTMTALDRKFIVKTAAENVKRSGRLITKEAIAAETEAIKAALRSWPAFGYKSALFAGEYASFAVSDVMSAIGREAYHNGLFDIDWNQVYETTLTMQANEHRAAFLGGLKLFHATIARPLTKLSNDISKNIIFKANRKYFDEYNKKTETALSHLRELTAPGKKEMGKDEVKKWIKEAREAVEARIALKEQLPSIEGEWALAEERAALAELKELEKSGVSEVENGLFKVGDVYATAPQVTERGNVVRGISFQQIWEQSDLSQKTALLRNLYNDAIRGGGKIQTPLQEVAYALDLHGIEARVPDVNNLAPRKAAEFIAEIVRQLDPLFAKSEAYDALYYRDYKTHKTGYDKAKAELRNAVSEIVTRHGNVLRAIIQNANEQPFIFAAELEAFHPFALAEAEHLLILANEKGEPSNPNLFERLLVEEKKVEDAFEAAKERAGDLPMPLRFASIDNPAEREELYGKLTGPFVKTARDSILPARAEQNRILQASGCRATVHDYRIEKLYGIPFDQVTEVADQMTRETDAANMAFLKMVAEARGVEVGELRYTDIEWAKRKISAAAAYMEETPAMTAEEAREGIIRLCRDIFNVDINEIIFVIDADPKHKSSNGVNISWADGEMLIVNIDPERITLDDYEKLLHEVGHGMHRLMAKRNFAAKGVQNIMPSATEQAEISEAFAKIVADTINDPAKIAQYLPGRFSQKYLEDYAKIRKLYESHKLRRTILLAHAAKVMADPSFPTLEEKQAELARLQNLHLGIGGDANWIFGVTHLANRDWYPYFMKYVLADYIARQIEARAETNGRPVADEFRPILELGGLMTPRQMHALGLGVSEQSAQRALDLITSAPSAASTFEAISGNKASEAGKAFGKDPSAFFGRLREYFHNSAIVTGRSYVGYAEEIAKKAVDNEANEDEIRQITEYVASMTRLLTFIETVETTPWLKDALITNSKFTKAYNQQLADINNLQDAISRYRSLLTNVALRMLSDAANKSYGTTQGDFLDTAAHFFGALEARIAGTAENAVILRYQGAITDAELAERLIGIKGEVRRAIGITTILSDVIKLLPLAEKDSRIVDLRTKLHNFRTSMSNVADIEDEMFRQPDFLKRIIIPLLITPRTDTLLAAKVKNIAEVMAKRAGRTVQIDVDSSLQKSNREIDIERAKKLEMAIANLVSNAIKYGNTTVSARIFLDADSNLVAIVSNDGISMSPAETFNYGQKGWRSRAATDSGIKGDGLGSGSILETVMELGGKLEITSTTADFTTKASLIDGRMVAGECDVVSAGQNKVTVLLKVPLKNRIEPERMMTTPPPDQTPAEVDRLPHFEPSSGGGSTTLDFLGMGTAGKILFDLGRSLLAGLQAYRTPKNPEISIDTSPNSQLTALAKEVAAIEEQSRISTRRLDVEEETSVQALAEGTASFFINHPEGKANFAGFCAESGMNSEDAVRLLQFSMLKTKGSETGWIYITPSGEAGFADNPHEALRWKFGYRLAEAASAGSANLWQYLGGLRNRGRVLRINALNLGPIPNNVLLAAQRQNILLANTLPYIDPEKSDVLIIFDMVAGHNFPAAKASKVGAILIGIPKEGEDVATGLKDSGWAVSNFKIAEKRSILAIKIKDITAIDDDEIGIVDPREKKPVIVPPPYEAFDSPPKRGGTAKMPAAGTRLEDPPPKVVIGTAATPSTFDPITDAGKGVKMLHEFVKAWPKELFATLDISNAGALWGRATADLASKKSALTDLADIVYQRAVMRIPVARGKIEPRATMIANFVRSLRANPDFRIPNDSDLPQQIKIFDGIFRTVVLANGSDEWRHYGVALMERFAEAEPPFIRIDAKTMLEIIYVVDIQREQFYILDGNMIVEPNENQKRLIAKYYEELEKAIQLEDYQQLALALSELEFNNPFLYRVAEGRAIRKAQTPEMKTKIRTAIERAIVFAKEHR
jgi:signal transduction histidine kinase